MFCKQEEVNIWVKVNCVMPLVLNHYHWVGEDMVVGARKNRWGWVQGTGEEKGVGGRLTCWQNSCLLSHDVLAWLLVTPQDGELARKLVGVPKGWEAGEIEGNPAKVLNIAQSKKGWREEAKKKGQEPGETEGRRFGTPAPTSILRVVVFLSPEPEAASKKVNYAN